MRFHRSLLCNVLPLYLAAWILFSCTDCQAATPIPPTPTDWLTDDGGFLSPEAQQQINARLRGYEKASGHQFIVFIDETTGGAEIEDWGLEAFNTWGIGNKERNDGLILFVMSADRTVRIQVGTGLESNVTDATASQIIDQQIIPQMKQGNRDEAVRRGVEALIAAAGGDIPLGSVPPSLPAEGAGAADVTPAPAAAEPPSSQQAAPPPPRIIYEQQQPMQNFGGGGSGFPPALVMIGVAVMFILSLITRARGAIGRGDYYGGQSFDDDGIRRGYNRSGGSNLAGAIIGGLLSGQRGGSNRSSFGGGSRSGGFSGGGGFRAGGGSSGGGMRSGGGSSRGGGASGSW